MAPQARVASHTQKPQMSSPAFTELPNIRLVTTGHKSDGTSVFTFDNTLEPFAPFGPAASRFTNIHMTPGVPASNTAPFPEITKTLARCPPGGVLFCTTDILPGGSAPMHRTLSMDYAVVLSGEIILELNNGDSKTVHTGEVMVQRGANHAWHNRTKEVCRILVVMVSTEKITLEDGRVLEETVFKKRD
ncbi:Cupin-2 domain-containing protein [Mycena kentingensis (nom. inval.)]|nr:Cupin-2 domain-containing protein [Mycena kentingensis (nom. inval.)]